MQKCEIHSVANSITAITAQGRAGTEDNGFVFINCMISGIGNAYLGRAWKDSSRVIMAYTYMSELINEKGWDNFGHPEYNEYGCFCSLLSLLKQWLGPGQSPNFRNILYPT